MFPPASTGPDGVPLEAGDRWVEAGSWASRARRLGPLRYSDLGRRRLPPPLSGASGPAGDAAIGALARWLSAGADRWWSGQGRPDPFTLVVVSGDTGDLAAAVLDQRPACAPALRYVLVHPDHPDPAALPGTLASRLPMENPAFLYPSAPPPEGGEDLDDEPAERPAAGGIGPLCTRLGEVPALGDGAGAVVALDLLSHLPFDAYTIEASGAVAELRLVPAGGPESAWSEIAVPLAEIPPDLPAGGRTGRVLRWTGGLAWVRRMLVAPGPPTLAVLERRARLEQLEQLASLRRPAGAPVDVPGTGLSVIEWNRRHVG